MTEAIMEMSAEIGEIAKAMPKAQADMGEVFKTATNPAFRSKYADLAAVVDAVVPALNKHGITLLQPVAFDGALVHVGTVLLHESGQWVRCTHSIPLSKRDAHGIGSATTYGRRQGLLAMSGVAPTDDDGNAAAAPAENTGRKDYGPAPIGPDFQGAEGKGKTAHAAKKDGTDIRFQELRNEIWGLESRAACMTWANARADEIKSMPESWRKQLRGDLDEQKATIDAQTEGDADFPGDRPAPLAGGEHQLADVA